MKYLFFYALFVLSLSGPVINLKIQTLLHHKKWLMRLTVFKTHGLLLLIGLDIWQLLKPSAKFLYNQYLRNFQNMTGVQS
ncbi:unnamed protein product [Blepharisma stoltei]|uniref:Uncharacterized protein n=1 Tax=Blepharisma stoltei TaxID=1481888 RepID=A0AAU9IK59_9CILI|nr:unnamed protein product [Blepharisma stoltei]